MHEADSKQDNLDTLKTELSGWMPSDGNVEKLLDASAEAMFDFDVTKENAGAALNIQTATTIEDLEKFGDIVQEYPDEGDSVDFYRKKILTKFQQLSVAGRPEEILQYASDLFNISQDKIKVQNITDQANFRITVPIQAISESVLTDVEAANLLKEIGAATYGAEVNAIGSLAYISETEYNNGTYDSTKGYATLDGNGDITSGGTYGTVFE